jgi:hypothetical protein
MLSGYNVFMYSRSKSFRREVRAIVMAALVIAAQICPNTPTAAGIILARLDPILTASHVAAA